MSVYPMDCALHAVLLKIEQGFPHFSVDDRRLFKQGSICVLAGNEPLEDMSLEVDEFRRVIDIELFEVAKDFVFYVRYKAFDPSKSRRTMLSGPSDRYR